MSAYTAKRIDDMKGTFQGAFKLCRAELGVSSFGMQILDLPPNLTEGYPEHDHETEGHEEVYLVLRGTIVLQAGGTERTLSQGDFVRVAPEMKRKFVTREEGATLLALGGTPGKPYTPAAGRPTKR